MDFREALITTALDSNAVNSRQRKRFGALRAEGKPRFPRLWKAMESIAIHRYEQDTGTKLVGKVDWSNLLTWLTENLPTILKIIAGNTEAINRVHDTSEELKLLMADIRDQLFQRPCLLQDARRVGRTHEDRTAETQ